MIVTQQDAFTEEIAPGITRIHYIDKTTGAGSVSMGMVILNPGCLLKPHKHLVEDAMIVVGGKGLFILNGTEYQVEQGMAFLAPAGMVHYLKNNGAEPFKVVYTWPSVEVERY